FQAEDGIRDRNVTGVQTCALPISGLWETIGVAASTCSYTDWIGSDLIVFFGSDVPNNQPVTTKYLYYAKKQGTKIAVVNPMREQVGRASCRERGEMEGVGVAGK